MDSPLSVEVTVPSTQLVAPGTLIVPVSDGLNPYRAMMVWARLQGLTGGTLDVYIQAQINRIGTIKWVDYAHYAQQAAGGAANEKLITVAREGGNSNGIITVGSDSTPALAANTIVGGDFGYALRLFLVMGAGTSAGAQQLFKFLFSTLGF